MLAMITTASVCHANEDERFVAGLRSRRLFSLAESYCQKQLAGQDLTEAQRADLTVELIRVYAQHALNEAGDKRQTLWEAARDLAGDFEATSPDHPRLFLVQVQHALSLLARGELQRMEAEVGADRAAALDAARTTLRAAAVALQEIEEQVTAAIPTRRRPTEDELSADELSALKLNVQYQAARVRLNQALCYPAGSSDRVAALTQVQETLEQPLLNLADDDPLAINCRLEQIVCLRLLGDLGPSEERLAEVALVNPPPLVQLRLRAEAIRLRLAEQKHDAALKIIGEGRTLSGVTSPELDFAFLETYVARWRAAADAQDEDATKKWREQSVAAVDFIERTRGRYWARRGELLLVEAGQGAGDGSVEILSRTADDLYRKGKLAEALVAYDKAAEAAREANDKAAAFQVAYKAALLMQQQREFAEASRRFQDLGVSMQSHPHAANAHALAIANMRSLLQNDVVGSTAYGGLLQEHLELWPAAKTSSIVAYWLGQLRELESQWRDAIDAYERVARGSKQDQAAIDALGRCWTRVLGQASDTTDVSRAVSYFDSVYLDDEGRFVTTWSAAGRAAVVAAARIRVRFTSSGFVAAEASLRAALASDPDEAWVSSAMPLLVLAVAGQEGRSDDARQLIHELGAASAQDLFDLLQRVNEIAKTATGTSRATFAQLQLDVVDRLATNRDNLSEREQQSIDQLRAEALATSGNRQAAIAAYDDLAKRYPSSGAIQEGYATLLLTGNDRASWQAALDQWRRVAAKSKPRTPRWFRAKYSVALALFRLDDKAAAAKLIRYLQATEDLNGSGLEGEFARLLQQCQS